MIHQGSNSQSIVRAGLLMGNAEERGEVVLNQEYCADVVNRKKLDYDSRVPWIDIPKNCFITARVVK